MTPTPKLVTFEIFLEGRRRVCFESPLSQTNVFPATGVCPGEFSTTLLSCPKSLSARQNMNSTFFWSVQWHLTPIHEQRACHTMGGVFHTHWCQWCMHICQEIPTSERHTFAKCNLQIGGVFSYFLRRRILGAKKPINRKHINIFLTALAGQSSQGRTPTRPRDKRDKMAILLWN